MLYTDPQSVRTSMLAKLKSLFRPQNEGTKSLRYGPYTLELGRDFFAFQDVMNRVAEHPDYPVTHPHLGSNVVVMSSKAYEAMLTEITDLQKLVDIKNEVRMTTNGGFVRNKRRNHEK